ncbi:MAG TPA: hypothetical protein VHM28_06190 [Anaerolineales bacterium]|jgi:hypothetical protein|nr:hypothetical protein [Anaerolineales bacterium]
MNHKPYFPSVIIIAALVLATLACGLVNTIQKATGGDTNMTAVSSLWSDVPPMDGMGEAQAIDMPAWLKALASPIMDAMMRGLNNGSDAGHWDWVAFMLSNKLPADVQAFYTPDRMSGFGWQQAEAACLPMTENGVLCSFTKEENSKTTGLIVLAATDEQKKETSVFFLRAEGVGGTPESTQSGGLTGGPISLVPIPHIALTADLTQINVCQVIPQQNMEALIGRKLDKAPEQFNYYDTGGSSGCTYEGAKDSDGESHYAYVVLTPAAEYNNQPLYLNVSVSGLGQEAYFNNGADARQLWVKVNDQVAFVIAHGDIENEVGMQQLAQLLVAALQ